MERMHPPRWRINVWRASQRHGWLPRFALSRPDYETPTWHVHARWLRWEGSMEIPSRKFA